MENKLTGNEPAFSTETNVEGLKTFGLTIRQHFAAMAMQGMWANRKLVDSVQRKIEEKIFDFDSGKDLIAAMAVQAADALISELNKPTTNEQ